MGSKTFTIKTGDMNIDIVNHLFDLFMESPYISFYDMILNDLNHYIIGINDPDASVLEIELVFRSEAHYTWFLVEFL
jgi:hypothetical protein